MAFSRSLILPVLFAVGTAAALGAGCSRRSETVAGPSGPPPTAQQRVQQIQSDPNASADVKNIRLRAAQENSGPPVRRP